MSGRANSIPALCVFVALAGLLTAGCQTTGGGQSSKTAVSGASGAGASVKAPGTRNYTLFSDQGDHLKELVAAGKYRDAAALYVAEKSFFQANPSKYRNDLAIVARMRNAAWTSRVSAAQTALKQFGWPANRVVWLELKRRLKTAADVVAEYGRSPMLAEPAYASPEMKALRRTVSAMNRAIRISAPDEFASYNHFGAQPFFHEYPADIDIGAFMAANFPRLGGTLNSASLDQIEAFLRNYPREIISAEHRASLGNHYVTARLKSFGKRRRTLSTVLAAIRAAKEAGLEPTDVPGATIGFVEVTSKTLLKQGQIDFPGEVEVDIPVRAAKSRLEDVLSGARSEASDYLIVFDVAFAKARRRISSKKGVSSRHIAGYRTQTNPEYNLAQNRVNQMQIEIQNAGLNRALTNSQFCVGSCFGKFIGQITAKRRQRNARKRLAEAMEKLKNTPMTVEVPVLRRYRFDKATVKATKLMTVHYYVIDRITKKYFKSTFDVEERKTFEVLYSLKPDDPDRKRHLSKAHTDANVAAWEEKPVSVKLTRLIDHYLENKSRAKRLTGLTALRREMLKDKNTALAKHAARTFDVRPRNDPRFDSVVVVYSQSTESAGLGSGFFVAPDVVLTNAHVVDDGKFVELKTYDGQETFGKVFATDLIRDLALVRVQSRGKPVRFYNKRSLDLGQTVEAIGHPRGLEFSVSRGVISAVRHRLSVVLQKREGKPILFIQTDVSINQGNSGGPLFLGRKVVGVNTQGGPANRVEGLNFAVHYSEVLDFLRENLSGFRVSAN